MKLVLPIWNNRISPVFDVARRLIVLDIQDRTVIKREEKPLIHDPLQKVETLRELRPAILICGAISQPLELLIRQSGIQVISNVCGAVDRVVEGFLSGQRMDQQFSMPGCCRRRNRFRGCRKQSETS